ncbi:MAG TPA: hypothetical protein PLP17_12525 [Oligoflexia bacterium]|nr:hypothetical protein [Oligoflexia bacterium]
MKVSRLITIFLAISCLFGVVACSDNDNGDDDVLDNGAPVGLDKVRRADEQAKLQHPLAKIVWAGGRLASGAKMDDPAHADTWDFDAIADDGSPQVVGMWELTLRNAEWEVTPLEWPPMEIEYIDLTTITMDVSEAWVVLQQAGLAQPFFTWELLKSLHPDYPNPFYAFHIGGGQYLLSIS